MQVLTEPVEPLQMDSLLEGIHHVEILHVTYVFKGLFYEQISFIFNACHCSKKIDFVIECRMSLTTAPSVLSKGNATFNLSER